MKIRWMLLSGLIVAAVLSVGYESSGSAKTKAEGGLMIGVVSVRRVFQECESNAKYKEVSRAEGEKLIADLSKLEAEIEAEKAGLNTLKPGSSDHTSQMSVVLEKQANLRAKEEFYKQQMELKDRQWTEDLYKLLLQEVGEVAKKKELDLVFDKDEVNFPSLSINDLMLTIRTNKLLYSGGCLDITSDVIAQLNAREKKK